MSDKDFVIKDENGNETLRVPCSGPFSASEFAISRGEVGIGEANTPIQTTFFSGAKEVLRICGDGRILVGDGFAPDEAGRKAVDAMCQAWPAMLEKVRREEREACAQIADRCADDETRKALGANAAINAIQIASAIRARSNPNT